MTDTTSSISEPELTDQPNFYLVLDHLRLLSTAYSTNFLRKDLVRGARKLRLSFCNLRAYFVQVLGTKELGITAKVLVEKLVSMMLYPFHQGLQ